MEQESAESNSELTIDKISTMTLAEKLDATITHSVLYDKAKKFAEKEQGLLGVLKQACLDEFEELGVSSMSAKGKTLYIHRQIWAGTAEGQEKSAVIEELQSLGLNDFITFNTQALSGYVRETAKQHPELINEKGNLIADAAQILAVLPGELPKLCKVTEKIDLGIRKST